MKNIVVLCLFFIFVNAGAQDMVTLKFVRPAKFQGSAAKIKVIIQDNEYILKNGSNISVNVPLEFYKPTRIYCKSGLNPQASIYLRPKPEQVYEFEVGFNLKGVYINLVSGEEALLGDSKTQKDSVFVDGKWQTQLKVDKDNLALGFKAEKVDDSEALRQEWLARGGRIYYTSVMLTGTYYSMDIEKIGKMNGYGGGFSANMNWINLKIPTFKPGLSTWNSSNIGWGYDIMLYSFKYGYTEPLMSVDISSLTMTILINLNLGWTFGMGKFIDEGNWKGVAFTFKYKPTMNLSTTSSTVTMDSSSPYIQDNTSTTSDSNFQLNAGGFGFDIDFSNFSATMNKLAPKPKTKLAFFVLPPVGDSPLFISVSLGISFYSR